MEKESIAYFYLQKGVVAKKYFYSKVQPQMFTVERERVRVTAIGIPEFYGRTWGRKKYVSWKDEKIKQYMLEQFQGSGAEHFFYGRDTALFLQQDEMQVPLFFMEEMLVRYGVRESVVLIGDPTPIFDSLFQNFMSKVNYLRIICENPADYKRETEWLYETYGIIAIFGKGGQSRTQMLVLDMEPSGKNGRPVIDLTEIPVGSVYMDMKSDAEKRKWITKKRKDIRYLSPESVLNKWCHLDTTAQNGYNTRVKLEVL